MKVSLRCAVIDLSALPDISSLKRLSQSLAVLDAILSPEWEYRYYSFNAHWNDGESVASMRNGQGDHYFCLFNAAGVILKGYCHEIPKPMYRDVPPQFAAFFT